MGAKQVAGDASRTLINIPVRFFLRDDAFNLQIAVLEERIEALRGELRNVAKALKNLSRCRRRPHQKQRTRRR